MIIQQPRPETPDEESLRISKEDAKQFLGLLNDEIIYLSNIIPTIDTMTAVEVRSQVKRLSQENLRILKALRVLLDYLKNI